MSTSTCVAALLGFNDVTELTHTHIHSVSEFIYQVHYLLLSGCRERARHTHLCLLAGKSKEKPTLVPIRAGLLFTSQPTRGVSYWEV